MRLLEREVIEMNSELETALKKLEKNGENVEVKRKQRFLRGKEEEEEEEEKEVEVDI